MKKVLLATTAIVLVNMAGMAADRFPEVTIKSKRNFEIVVDGRNYGDNHTIRFDRMRKGVHTIKVYERTRGLFGRMRLVSHKNFFVGKNDIRITIDRSGFVNIDETGKGRGRGWDNDDDKRWGRNHDRDRDRDRDRDPDWDE